MTSDTLNISSNSSSQKTRTVAIYMLTAALASVICNLNTLANGFVWDDAQQVLNNIWITDTRYLKDIFTNNVAGFVPGSATSYYRPLMHVFYMGIYGLFGLQSWAWHLANVLLHTAAVIVLFLFSRRLLCQTDAASSQTADRIAFAASLLFAVHPIHTEAVAWVGALPELAYSLLYLLAVWTYMRCRGDKGLPDIHYSTSLALYFLAMLCKEPATTLPLVIVAYDYTERRSFRTLPYRRYIPYLGLACMYLLLRFQALGGFAPSQRFPELSTLDVILNGPVLFAHYLGKLILPANLTALYTYVPVTTILTPGVAVSLLASAAFAWVIWTARYDRRMLLSLLLILLPLLPALYIPALSASVFAERYLYLPSAGFAILLGLGLQQLWKRTGMLLPVSLLLVTAAAYGSLSFGRNAVWKDSLTLWHDAAMKSPASAQAHLYYGYALHEAGFLDNAAMEYRNAIDLDTTMIDAYINLGVVYQQSNRIEDAIRTYLLAQAHDPRNAKIYECLGSAYQAAGDATTAYVHYQKGIQLHPGIPELHNALGKLYANMARYDEAASEFQRAAALAPDNGEYAANLDQVMKLRQYVPAP
jgi:tetratricopeptide (TPR) repeat protein